MLGEEAESSTSARRRGAELQVLSDSPAHGPLCHSSIKATPGTETTSVRWREVEREALLSSPVHVTPHRTSTMDPPPYGAQHRQDALWEGGNEALPPLWHQYKVFDGGTHYQDDTLIKASFNLPVPGMRLDVPGDLVPGCEWHISPLGRSYFIDHNTRTTSWKKPLPERPAGSLMPECIIEGHSKCIWSLACISTDHIMSTSSDGSICQWKRDGELVRKLWNSDGGGIGLMAVSPDATLVVCESADCRLRQWNIREGSMVGNPWEGHNAAAKCLDWCPNAMEIASGWEDGTIRRWDPDTGRQIAPPIETGHGWVNAVKYSAQGDRFASGGEDKVIRVWSMHGEVLIEIEGHDNAVTSLCWSKDGAHIFSASNTIRKWRSIDGKELVVLRGHTNVIRSLCLSPDERHIVSASEDSSVRIWDLETNQQVGDTLLHDDAVLAVAMFPDGKYFVSAGKDAKICVWSLEAALKQQGGDRVGSADDGNAELKGRATPSRDLVKNRGLAKYGGDFWGSDINRTPGRAASPPTSSSWRSLFASLRFSTRPTHAPQPIPLQPRRWNFNLFSVGRSGRPVYVAPARDEDRYGIAPPTEAEVAAAMQRPSNSEVDGSTQSGQDVVGAQFEGSQGRPKRRQARDQERICIAPPTKEEVAAAMQRPSGNEANNSTQTDQSAAGAQGSQGRPTQTQGSTDGMGEFSYEVSCCGFFFGCRPPSHQS